MEAPSHDEAPSPYGCGQSPQFCLTSISHESSDTSLQSCPRVEHLQNVLGDPPSSACHYSPAPPSSLPCSVLSAEDASPFSSDATTYSPSTTTSSDLNFDPLPLPDPPCPTSNLPSSSLLSEARNTTQAGKPLRTLGRRPGRLFSSSQTSLLEETFGHHPYPTPQHKRDLAQQLGLSEEQVKGWFQNRRTKERKKRRASNLPEDDLNVSRWHKGNKARPLPMAEALATPRPPPSYSAPLPQSPCLPSFVPPVAYGSPSVSYRPVRPYCTLPLPVQQFNDSVSGAASHSSLFSPIYSPGVVGGAWNGYPWGPTAHDGLSYGFGLEQPTPSNHTPVQQYDINSNQLSPSKYISDIYPSPHSSQSPMNPLESMARPFSAPVCSAVPLPAHSSLLPASNYSTFHSSGTPPFWPHDWGRQAPPWEAKLHGSSAREPVGGDSQLFLKDFLHMPLPLLEEAPPESSADSESYEVDEEDTEEVRA